MNKKRSRSLSEARKALKSLISACESYKETWDWFDEQFLKLAERFNLPKSDWRYLTGFRDCAIEFWYRYRVAFGYVDPTTGKIYHANWDEIPEKMRAELRSKTSGQLLSAHFWISDKKTLLRPFGRIALPAGVNLVESDVIVFKASATPKNVL